MSPCFFISTLIICKSSAPAFFNACGPNGSDHNAEWSAMVLPMLLESSNTLPAASYLIKSDQLITMSDEAKRCVCTAVVSPGGILASSTRTNSFSNNSLWCCGAAINASSSSGHCSGCIFIGIKIIISDVYLRFIYFGMKDADGASLSGRQGIVFFFRLRTFDFRLLISFRLSCSGLLHFLPSSFSTGCEKEAAEVLNNTVWASINCFIRGRLIIYQQ
jgi:hypothetical protein